MMRRIMLIAALAGSLIGAASIRAQEPVHYARDVARILSNNCFTCHGPDEKERKAGLRLDRFEGATAPARSGAAAIVPGDPDGSPLIARILSHDLDERMPPESKGGALPPESIALLRSWIAQGAKYERHWAFEAPVRPEVPAVPAYADRIRNPIDAFVFARLEAEGLAPNEEAEKGVWLRRASLDLTGLPPSHDALRAFLDDDSPEAYEKAADAMLASPHYGERWAQMWLDLARYADTKGYEKDDPRTVWPYRDWVIRAFNDDMPYDAFTRDQLAGDLLPGATLDQQLATAFHRNTMTNDEGGTDDEEFRTAAIVDRVNTTMQTWMGMTMACAQCHTHKYDPLTHREYYEFAAFFNQTEDGDYNPERPLLKVPTTEQQQELDATRDRLREVRKALTDAVDPAGDRTKAEELVWGPWYETGPLAAEDFDAAFDRDFGPEAQVDLAARYLDGAAYWKGRSDFENGKVLAIEGENSAFYFYRTVESPRLAAIELSIGSDDALKVWWNGELRIDEKSHRGVAADQNLLLAAARPGVNTLLVKVVNGEAGGGVYFNLRDADFPPALAALLEVPESDRTDEQRTSIETYQQSRNEAAELNQKVAKLEAAIPEVPVMRELPEDQRRPDYIFEKGSFLNRGEDVSAGVPSVFNAWPEDAPRNRLGLADWLVSEDNPLTARVMMNRVWERFFGHGIVATLEDFGTQGDWPTHQELLDWLATEYMAQGWHLKPMLKMIVLSETYRQSSVSTPEKLEHDPFNVHYARGPRFRLPAEAVRDQALFVSGLLSEKMSGPPVMPPQPDGVWQIVYSNERWVESKGEDKYRRGLYTYWRRSSPYPSMVAFDAATRDVCTARRMRTNTPLQALVALNDPVYVEAAQALARRAVDEAGVSTRDRAQWIFEAALSREPTERELDALIDLYRSEFDHYRENAEDAVVMASNPLGPLPEEASPHTMAAWTVVSNVVMNTDEFLSKR
ncbi:MAG: DUF1553 domain-containing protein [Candidatus Hydrogenedens sp.]|nr:DUF1553 domain-containing protein [Candidatus Hydrogenedens sp.]